jgi:hypothetical protein
MKTILTAAFFLIHLTAFSQAKNWEATLNQALQDFKTCMTAENKTVCQTYTAKAIKQVYSVTDFYQASSKSDMTPFEIQEFISNSSRWTNLGQAFKPEVLSKAQELSNAGKLVLVILKGDSPADAHVSLVLPGDLQASGSWGMSVPNVAAFFTHNPGNSFVNKSVSYAYTKGMILQLEVYARN